MKYCDFFFEFTECHESLARFIMILVVNIYVYTIPAFFKIILYQPNFAARY